MFLISAIAVTAFLGGWQPSKVNIVFGAGALFFTLIFATKSLSYFVRLVFNLTQGKKLFDLLATVKPIKIRKPIFILYALLSIGMASIMQLFADHWLVTLLFFIAKTYFLVFVIIWIRWTLPRIRIDQMMSLCWKKLVPLAFICILWTGVAMVFGDAL
jgi:NADH:ubiquinone oxidoreductase subunit H